MNNIPLIEAIIVCGFIWSIKSLASANTAKNGNNIGIISMIVLITYYLLFCQASGLVFCIMLFGAGVGVAVVNKIDMTMLPQLMAGFHSLVGFAAVLIGAGAFFASESFGIGVAGNIGKLSLLEIGIGTSVGAITFTGSCIAFLKLSDMQVPFANQVVPNSKMILYISVLISIFSLILFVFSGSGFFLFLLAIASFIVGRVSIEPIGGADIPIVISMLNSYSGWAAVGIGFTLNNLILIVVGSIVGSSGAMLSYVMCKNMNRTIINVMFGYLCGPRSIKKKCDIGKHCGQSNTNKDMCSTAVYENVANNNCTENNNINKSEEYSNKYNTIDANDVALLLKKAKNIMVIPGYGMAVSKAQSAIKGMTEKLSELEIKVYFAIHPVAGRMPGHMNVLLAEVGIPYSDILDLEESNEIMNDIDIVCVIGANDTVNPAAKYDETSPIYGMPIIDTEKCNKTIVIKRSMNVGYAGIDNPLFYKNNTYMLLGDAKPVIESIIHVL